MSSIRAGDTVRVKSIAGVSHCPIVKAALDNSVYTVAEVMPVYTDEYPDGADVYLREFEYMVHSSDVEVAE